MDNNFNSNNGNDENKNLDNSSINDTNSNWSNNGNAENYAGSLYSYSYVNQNRSEQTQNQPVQDTRNQEQMSQGENNWRQASQSENNWRQASQNGNNWKSTFQNNATGNTYREQNRGYNTSYYEQQPQSGQAGGIVSKKKKGRFGKTLIKCAAIALVFGLVGGTVFYGTGYVFNKVTGNNQVVTQATTPINNKVTTTTTATQAVVSDISDVVSNVMPSIVSITNMSVKEYQGWFGQVYSEEVPSAGSGIIIAQTEEELYIVTNNHVVEGASTLTVNFVNDQTVSAEIKGTDSSTDLAVITVKVGDIPADTLSQIKVATLGKSESLKVGEPAIAIGNALGYGQSVTTGVISALDREVTVSDANNNSITNSLIQTDAAINPGNSGGALLNINGEVIGINSVKYSDTDVEGMGYAIPISTAEPIINDLITKQVVEGADSAYLGVAGVDVTDEVSETYNMPKGVYVAQVTPGSAAEKAGIKQGDIITSFDGREIDSMEALAERMKYYAAGTVVEVTVKTAQGGEYVENTISVTLGRKS